MPISSLWQFYIRSVNRPDTGTSTLRQYEYQVERFVDWVRKSHPEIRTVNGVTKAVARGFATSITSLSGGSFNKYVRLMSLVFRVLTDEAGLKENPWMGITRRRNNPNSKRPFTLDELKNIFSTAKGEHLTICLLGFHSALRLADCCLLTWKDVDMTTKLITVTPRKTARTSGKVVVIPIHPELAAHLQAIRPVDATGYVCPEFAATYLKDVATVTDRFQSLFRRCGIRLYQDGTGGDTGKRAVVEVGFHSYRHSWTSRFSQNRLMDSASIRAIAGWNSAAMERIYTHVSVEHLQQAMNKGMSVMGGGNPVADKAPEVDVENLDSDSLTKIMKAVEAEMKRREQSSVPA